MIYLKDKVSPYCHFVIPNLFQDLGFFMRVGEALASFEKWYVSLFFARKQIIIGSHQIDHPMSIRIVRSGLTQILGGFFEG